MENILDKRRKVKTGIVLLQQIELQKIEMVC